MNITTIQSIETNAAQAAEQAWGPQANPFPEGSEAAAHWNRAYYAAVQQLAVEVCA